MEGSKIADDEEWEALRDKGLIHGTLTSVMGGWNLQCGGPSAPQWLGLTELEEGYLLWFENSRGAKTSWLEPNLGGLLYRIGVQFVFLTRELEEQLDGWAKKNNRAPFDVLG